MDACSSVISPWGRSGPSGRRWQAVRAGLGLQGWGTAVRMLARRTIVGSGRAGHAADAHGGGTRPFTGRGLGSGKWFGGWEFRLFLAGSVSASLLSVHALAAVSTHSLRRMGRSKKSGGPRRRIPIVGRCGAACPCQIASCQEDSVGEDEPGV